MSDDHLPVADVAAAAACWLARFRHGDDGLAITEAHPKRCRFCVMPMPTLLTYSLGLCDPAEVKAWMDTPARVRAEAVAKAAEPEWWTELP